MAGAKPVSEIMDVTPEMATEWLERNINNRSISDDRVQAYARDMRNGHWRLNNQGIAFDYNGVLLDGQHRLWAITEAGVTIRLLVCMGLEPEARATIDKMRPRKVSDELRMQGVAHASKKTQMLNVINGLLNRHIGRIITYDETKDLLEKYSVDLEWAAKTFPGGRKIDQVAVAGAFAFAYRTDPARVEEFALRVRSGAGLVEEEPAAVLRYFLLERLPQRKETARVVSVKTLRAIQAFLENDIVLRLMENDDAVVFFARAHGLDKTLEETSAPTVTLPRLAAAPTRRTRTKKAAATKPAAAPEPSPAPKQSATVKALTAPPVTPTPAPTSTPKTMTPKVAPTRLHGLGQTPRRGIIAPQPIIVRKTSSGG